MSGFRHQEILPLGEDRTPYRLVSSEHVSTFEAAGHTFLRVVPTATGFVMEHEETQRGERTEVARKLWLCEVREGRITEMTAYCNGGWDDELRARHAAEAPMLRP